MGSSKSKPVMFFDANGNEVSNDPTWRAKQQIRTMKDTIVDDGASDDPSDPNEDPSDDDDSDGVESKSLDDMKSGELKDELARRREAGREIDTDGVKNASQLREVLKADDEKAANEADADGDSSDE